MTDKKSLEHELCGIEEQIAHSAEYALDARDFIYRGKLVGNHSEVEHWSNILEETESEIDELREVEAVLHRKIRQLHLNWVSQVEESGGKLHEQGYNHGWPLSPKSLLMYLDGDNLVFQRDEQDRYSSYRFWIDTMEYVQPVLCLGLDYFSSEQLGVDPAIIDRLYELEQKRIGGCREDDVQSEIVAIRSLLKPKLDGLP